MPSSCLFFATHKSPPGHGRRASPVAPEVGARNMPAPCLSPPTHPFLSHCKIAREAGLWKAKRLMGELEEEERRVAKTAKPEELEEEEAGRRWRCRGGEEVFPVEERRTLSEPEMN
ncbi:hypothetical protein Taro_018535 [Colocasia esculenta]|uniref:Uncharacterized protein n=1 Tax=Colocasia esculenta TaxID=4460 RepID=A0A843URA0_COLES|nr:hypothetical protein [Colocasia esculenta]